LLALWLHYKELQRSQFLSLNVHVIPNLQQVTLTDYPSDLVIDTIKRNALHNLSNPLPSNVQVEPHLWGDVESSFAQKHAHHYDRVLAADTLWMASEHENLAKSMAYFLSQQPDAKVLIVAGFHTGRAKVAHFFEVIGNVGLVVDAIWEISTDGDRRVWDPQQEGGIGLEKRWMIVACLKWQENMLS
jgi:hypothetical protein